MAEKIRDMQNRLTKDVICNSLLEMLSEKPFSKITVSDICRTAEINRGTFYLHYRDINDIIDYINTWYISSAMPYFKMAAESDGYDANPEIFVKGVKGILSVLSSWPSYSRIILGEEKGQSVIDRVTQYCEEIFIEQLHEKDIPESEIHDLLYDYYRCFYGGWGIVRKWCKEGMKESPEKIAEYLSKIRL